MTEVVGTLGILVGLIGLVLALRDLRKALAAKHAFEQKLLQEAQASGSLRQTLIRIGSLAPRTANNLKQAVYEIESLNEFKSAVDKAVLELGPDHQAVVRKSLSRPRASYLDDVVKHVSRDLTASRQPNPYSTSAV